MTSCALYLFVVCATLRHAAADCTALGCVLTAGEHKWSAIVRGDEWTLSLSISEEQDSAAGSLLRGGVAEAVSAAVSFSRSSNEAMVAWASAETQANWSAIIFHLAPHTIYVHGSGGELVELERVEIERSAARPTATTSGALTDPEGGTGSSSYLPVPGTNVRLRSPIDGACLLTVPGSDAPMFGSCDGAGSVWALLTGREPYSRGLRNVERGMCLQRKCYSGGKNPMQLGKCGVCGTMRWTLDRSRLVTPSLTSSAFFCISRALSSPEAAAAARAATVRFASAPAVVTPAVVTPAVVTPANATDADATNTDAAANATSAHGAADAAVDDSSSNSSSSSSSGADDDAEGHAGTSAVPSAEPSAVPSAAYTAPCGADAEPVLVETARLLLSQPGASPETLLDDWLARLGAAQRAEVGELMTALGTARASAASSLAALSSEKGELAAEVTKLNDRPTHARAHHGALPSPQVTKLNGQAASLSEQLELTKLKSEQTSQALDGTQKQLKMARTAREAALTSERHWKSQLMEAQGRADALQEATGAAMNETDAASVRLGETTSTIPCMHVLTTAPSPHRYVWARPPPRSIFSTRRSSPRKLEHCALPRRHSRARRPRGSSRWTTPSGRIARRRGRWSSRR